MKKIFLLSMCWFIANISFCMDKKEKQVFCSSPKHAHADLKQKNETTEPKSRLLCCYHGKNGFCYHGYYMLRQPEDALCHCFIEKCTLDKQLAGKKELSEDEKTQLRNLDVDIENIKKMIDPEKIPHIKYTASKLAITSVVKDLMNKFLPQL
jgi:hypothetical protein